MVKPKKTEIWKKTGHENEKTNAKPKDNETEYLSQAEKSQNFFEKSTYQWCPARE